MHSRWAETDPLEEAALLQVVIEESLALGGGVAGDLALEQGDVEAGLGGVHIIVACTGEGSKWRVGVTATAVPSPAGQPEHAS